MNDEDQQLIDAYLDDGLSSEDMDRLNVLLKQNGEFTRRFAQAMLLHDRLHAVVKAHVLTEETAVAPRMVRRPWLLRRRWNVTAVAAAVALLLVGAFLWHGGSVTTASAAVVALDRMIEAAREPIDRVYRIRVTDPGGADAEPPVFSGEKGRKPGIDGAELYVRGSDQFILVRRFADGAKFVTGSDGTIGWAAAPKGHVHLSRDIRRFRRAVPGEHEELPFIDLQAGFAGLRRGYDLNVVSVVPAGAESKNWSKLEAVKRPDRRSGAERVQVLFDAAGVGHRIELSGLPPGELRARSVVIELVEQRDLGSDFFKHESHHSADRPIDWE